MDNKYDSYWLSDIIINSILEHYEMFINRQ